MIGQIGALAIALTVLWRKPGAPEYSLTVIWALIGIIAANGTALPLVTGTAAVGILLLAGMALRGMAQGGRVAT